MVPQQVREKRTGLWGRFLAYPVAVCLLWASAGIGCTSADKQTGTAGGATLAGAGGTSALGGSGGTSDPAGAGGAPPSTAGETGASGAAGTSAGGAPQGGTPNLAGEGGVAGSVSEPDAGEPIPTSSFVYVSGYASPISTLVLDHATGALTPTSSVETGDGGEPTFIAFSPNKQFAYAIDEQLNGPLARMIAYTVDGASGALSEINRRDVGTSVNAHVGIHHSGDWVLSANYGGGSVTVFPVRDDGGLDPAMAPVPAGGQAHQIVFDQTGSILFVPCLTSSYIAVYDFADGVLTPRNPATIPIDGGPRHLAFTPDQRFVYVLTQGESTISAFEYDATTVAFTPIETIPSTPEGSLSAHIEVHKSGKFLYTSNRQDDSIAIFTIDQVTGKLTNVGYQREMLTFPRFFGIDPTGELMIIASQDTAQILVHRIDQQTGLLSVIGPPLNVPPEPTFVGMLAIP